ncbi:MAG: ABC-2 family transporter protein [Candidatus Micrarchaeota archaeon]|nr:ABC-2 family transporter protein [Candidatus Micrarchaeota archaeon]
MSSGIRRTLHLFALTQVYTWKSFISYRFQSVFWFLSSILQALLTFVFVSVIYQVSTGIPGWGYLQMLLLTSVTIVVTSGVIYLMDIYNISESLLMGNFDSFLTKPMSPYFVFLSSFTGTSAIGGVITGIILFAYAASQLHFGVLNLIAAFAIFALGILIALIFVMVLIMGSYKIFRGGGWVNWLFSILGNITKYPLSIYGVIGSLLMTFIIPLGFASYYPVEALSGKIGAEGIIVIILLAIAIIFLLSRIFEYLFKSYSSAMG